LLTKSLEPLGIPALTSSSPLIECDLGGTVGPDGEVDRRSTRFLGRIPSFAESQLCSVSSEEKGRTWIDLSSCTLLWTTYRWTPSTTDLVS
jgi:hypothetical protein